jgi:hypothetical protein
MQHAAGPNCFLERRVLGIVGQFGFFFGVQVVEIAEELVEAVHRRQVLVPIAEMVLAELAGGVAERLQQLGDGRVFLLKSNRGAGHADLGQPVRIGFWPVMNARAASRAALLTVLVGERHAFLGHAVDVGRLVAHHARLYWLMFQMPMSSPQR